MYIHLASEVTSKLGSSVCELMFVWMQLIENLKGFLEKNITG